MLSIVFQLCRVMDTLSWSLQNRFQTGFTLRKISSTNFGLLQNKELIKTVTEDTQISTTGLHSEELSQST